MIRRAALLPLLALIACDDASSEAPPEGGAGGAGGSAPVTCEGDEAAGTVTVFARLGASSEGLAFSDDGRLFVGSGDAVLELLPDGGSRPFASVPRTVGIAWWGDSLYVASGDDGSGAPDVGFCAPGAMGAIWRVTREGVASRFSEPLPQPNFLAVTPWDTLLVATDCREETILREVRKDGTVRDWLEGIPSANGLAFDEAGGTLYALSTFVDEPPLWEVQVAQDGTPGTPLARFSFATGSTPDGLALDARGTLYAALNVDSTIARARPAGPPSTLATDVAFAASLAFGDGDGFDPCSLYVTSLLGQEVHRVRVGTPGLRLRR